MRRTAQIPRAFIPAALGRTPTALNPGTRFLLLLRASAILLACTVVLAGLLGSVQAEPTTQTTEVWETEASLGNRAVVFELDGGSSCGVRVDFSGRMPASGVIDRIYLEEAAGGQTRWSHDSHTDDSDTDTATHLHVQDVLDTRSGGSQIWASRTSFPILGGSTLTVAAPDLRPWPSHLQEEWDDGSPVGKWSIRVEIVCHSGFNADLQVSRDPEIISMRNIGSGLGATSPSANGILVSETARSFSEPEVRLRAATEGAEAGRMSLEGPGGTENWLLYPSSPRFLRADGGSGGYVLHLDRAEAFGNTFWALLMGLEPVEDFGGLSG